MATYKQIFFLKFANDRGNIRKGVSAEEVWSSLEEFLRLVLTPKPKVSKRKTVKVNNDLDRNKLIENYQEYKNVINSKKRKLLQENRITGDLAHKLNKSRKK